MAYASDGRLPVIYVRGFAGSGIDQVVDDPFYGFNEGSVHVRVDGSGDPRFHQFESPMLRLITDEGYQLLVQGDQRAFLEGSEDGQVSANTLWVHRFYDISASTFGRKPREFSLENAAEDLFALTRLVLRKTGAPRVFLVAHSMGGLICRSMIQRVIPDASDPADDPAERLRAATRYVARVFTYATPHGGIEFAVGGGLLEKVRDLTGFQGADIFGPGRMYEYLTPALPDVPERKDFDATTMPAGGFPLDDLFCLVGTNPADYSVARGLSSWAVGARSDGLVQIDNAYVKGAQRAMVHRSHSGRFGIVNSEEGYQNLRRFLFGDLQVKVDLAGLDVQGTEADDMVWQLETALSIRGLPVLVHEQSTAHFCPVQIEHRRQSDAADTPVPLLTTFLSSRVPRPLDRAGHAVPTLRHALKLRLISVRERNGVFSFLDHLEQTEDWQDILVVDIAAGTERELPRGWAVWNSVLPTAIRDWAPEPANAIGDTDPAPGRWRGRVALPPMAHELLGRDACLLLTVTGRSV
jgi:pimeloyl-ACP methyl ester carboxylesterase